MTILALAGPGLKSDDVLGLYKQEKQLLKKEGQDHFPSTQCTCGQPLHSNWSQPSCFDGQLWNGGDGTIHEWWEVFFFSFSADGSTQDEDIKR